MPNFEKGESRFFGFVVTYYRNDPYLMLDKFSDLIAAVAAEVSINWHETRSNVALDGQMIKGRHVSGLERADSGRVSVVAFENTHTWSAGGVDYTIRYPSIRFRNFRKHFPDPVLFDGYKALMDEFDKLRNGTRVARMKPDPSRYVKIIEGAEARRQIEAQEKKEAVEKDRRWLPLLTHLSEPCPYFASKGVPEIYEWCDLLTGETTKGNYQGLFTAIQLVDLATGKFRGIQRIYPETNAKIFRRGLDPTGAAFPVPSRLPNNGEPIYVLEAAADAGMAYKVTGRYSVGVYFADNMQNIVSILRSLCPDSEIIMVADNDQYGGPNKGVDVCEAALRETPGKTYVIIPQFEQPEKELRYKDLTDYAKAYGLDETRRFLLSY